MRIVRFVGYAHVRQVKVEDLVVDLSVMLGGELEEGDDCHQATTDLCQAAVEDLRRLCRRFREAEDQKDARARAETLRLNIFNCQSQLGRLIDCHPELREAEEAEASEAPESAAPQPVADMVEGG